MAALRASRLVCSAMPRITSSTMLALSVSSCCTTLPACSIWRETCSMLPMALRTTWLPWVEAGACLAAPMASVVLVSHLIDGGLHLVHGGGDLRDLSPAGLPCLWRTARRWRSPPGTALLS